MIQRIGLPKNWCFRTVVLEKTLESPLNSKEIKSVNPKGNQLWIFIGRTDAKAEASILWSPDAKSQLIGKDPDAGKDWGYEQKGATEDEVVGWHHWLSAYECEQALGDGEGQGSLACLQSMWSQKVRHDLAIEQQHLKNCTLLMSGKKIYILLLLWAFSSPGISKHFVDVIQIVIRSSDGKMGEPWTAEN